MCKDLNGVAIDCEKSLKFEDNMYNRFDRIPACDKQRDRQTDGRTKIHLATE